jgi:serine/threonine protein kinase
MNAQVSSAVSFLHSRPTLLVHRDLKPENILLGKDRETGRLVAKICDFGLLAVGAGESICGEKSGDTEGSPKGLPRFECLYSVLSHISTF